MAKPEEVVGRNVALARQIKGWTQTELAKRVGWSRQAMSEAEHGRRDWRIADIVLVAQALEIRPELLLTFTDG